LVIGAGNYDTLGTLRYAPADARAFGRSLVEDFRFQPESVTRLTDDDATTRPTVANIRAALDKVLADPRLNKGDLFIFYFSGHGIGTPKGDFLCPTDATIDNVAEVGLPVKEVMERFVKAGLKNVLVIADACRGGEKNTFGEELNRLSDQANIGVMLGCQPGSRSYQWSRMGHGYFTYHLLEALKNPELRQKGTGALWASEVGKWMQGQVEASTKSSQDTPQVPAIECDDRRDIMIGAFLPAKVEAGVVESLKEQLDRLPAERQAASVSDYAHRLFQAEQFFEAAEMLRIVDQLGASEPADRLVLGTSLSILGRTSEASRAFDQLLASEDSVFRHMAVLLDERQSDLRAKGIAVRALIRGIREVPACLGFVTLLGSPGTNPDKAEVIKLLLREGTGVNDRVKAYLEGDLAIEEGRFSDAENSLREALKTFGLTPDDHSIRYKLADVLKSRNDFKGHVKLCDEAIATGDRATYWRLSKAATLRFFLDKRDEAAAEVKASISDDLTPGQLVDCLGIAGRRAEDFAAELRAQTDRFPRSWEAHVVRFLVDSLVEGDIVADLPTDHPARRYAADDRIVAKGFELAYQAIWTDWVEEGSIPNEIYRDLMIYRSGRLVKLIQTTDDVDLWWYATLNGIRAFRTPQLHALYNSKFGAAQTKLSPTSRAHYAIVAFNAADWPRFDLLASSGLTGGDAQNIAWLRALSLVIRGLDVQAATLVAGLPDPTVDYQGMADGLRVYAAATTLKGAALEKHLKAADSEDTTAKALIGLAWLRAGKLAEARPLLEESLSMMNWAFQSLHAHALSKLGQALRAAKEHEDADAITYALQLSQPGQPALAILHYGTSPAIPSGKFEFTGRQVDDDTKITPATAAWTIGPAGDLKGEIGGRALVGKVDRFGNFVGSAGGWNATAKLAPLATYKAFGPLQDETQVVTLLSPNGERLIFALKFKSQ